eukprot:3552672-Heterocapsa_arctica.AAC.1
MMLSFSLLGHLGGSGRRTAGSYPPNARQAFAGLLLEMRLLILPDSMLDAKSNIGRVRYDVRGITELLSVVAARPPSARPSLEVKPMVKNTVIHVMEPTPYSLSIRCSSAPLRLQYEPGLSTSTSNQDSDVSSTRTSDGGIGLSSCLAFDDMPFRIYELTRAFARLE